MCRIAVLCPSCITISYVQGRLLIYVFNQSPLSSLPCLFTQTGDHSTLQSITCILKLCVCWLLLDIKQTCCHVGIRNEIVHVSVDWAVKFGRINVTRIELIHHMTAHILRMIITFPHFAIWLTDVYSNTFR